MSRLVKDRNIDGNWKLVFAILGRFSGFEMQVIGRVETMLGRIHWGGMKNLKWYEYLWDLCNWVECCFAFASSVYLLVVVTHWILFLNWLPSFYFIFRPREVRSDPTLGYLFNSQWQGTGQIMHEG